VVPVKTAQAIPKEKIEECMEAIRDVTAEAPVALGDVIIPDVAGTGIDVIATGNAEKR
jgi:CxxC motif-containing protein